IGLFSLGNMSSGSADMQPVQCRHAASAFASASVSTFGVSDLRQRRTFDSALISRRRCAR
ncbi:MAG: hypothetical protein WAZ97_25045, partial [Pseudolabrys sp.]